MNGIKRMAILLALTLPVVFPASAQQPAAADVQKIAILSFEESSYSIGKVKLKGGSLLYEIRFTNTGNAPLVITRTEAGCRCISANGPRKPVGPGESGLLSVKYTPKEIGSFDNEIAVFSNGADRKVVIRLQGEVVK